MCVLIAAAFIASGWWLLGVQVPTQYGPEMNAYCGAFYIFFAHQWEPVLRVESHVRPRPSWHRWNEGRSGRGFLDTWRARLMFSDGRPYLEIPLYALFLAVAIPTLLVWRFWPKPVKPGHCRCGYDLTGNTSGVCPECGVEVQA